MSSNFQCEIPGDICWKILQTHGAKTILHYIKQNLPENKQREVCLHLESLFTNSKEETEAEFTATVLKFAFSMNTTNICLRSTDEVQRDLHGISPPIGYYVNYPKHIRFNLFFKSFSIQDIFVFRVIDFDEKNKEYLLLTLAYAFKQQHYIDDLNVKMYLKNDDVPENVVIGSLVRGVLFNIDISINKLYISLKESCLDERVPFTLGAITENDLPLHYKLLNVKPVNSLESFYGLSEKKIPNQARNICRVFGIDEYEIPSLHESMRHLNINRNETITYFLENEKKEADAWFRTAQYYYYKEELYYAIRTLDHVFESDPCNFNGFLMRAELYSRLNYPYLSIQDLQTCLKVRKFHPKAMKLFGKAWLIQSIKFYQNGNLKAAIRCLFRLFCYIKFMKNEKLKKFFLKLMIQDTLQDHLACTFSFDIRTNNDDDNMETNCVREMANISRKMPNIERILLHNSMSDNSELDDLADYDSNSDRSFCSILDKVPNYSINLPFDEAENNGANDEMDMDTNFPNDIFVVSNTSADHQNDDDDDESANFNFPMKSKKSKKCGGKCRYSQKYKHDDDDDTQKFRLIKPRETSSFRRYSTKHKYYDNADDGKKFFPKRTMKSSPYKKKRSLKLRHKSLYATSYNRPDSEESDFHPKSFRRHSSSSHCTSYGSQYMRNSPSVLHAKKYRMESSFSDLEDQLSHRNKSSKKRKRTRSSPHFSSPSSTKSRNSTKKRASKYHNLHEWDKNHIETFTSDSVEASPSSNNGSFCSRALRNYINSSKSRNKGEKK